MHFFRFFIVYFEESIKSHKICYVFAKILRTILTGYSSNWKRRSANIAYHFSMNIISGYIVKKLEQIHMYSTELTNRFRKKYVVDFSVEQFFSLIRY